MKRNIYIIWLLIGLFGMGEASLFYGCGGVTETGNPESVDPGDEPVPGEEGLPGSLICEILEAIRKSYPVIEEFPSEKTVEKFHPTADTTTEDIRKVSTYTRFCDLSEEAEISESQVEEIIRRENLRENLESIIAIDSSGLTSEMEEKIIYALDAVIERFSELDSGTKATWALAVLSAELTPRYPEIFGDIENADREQILEFFKNL